MNPTPPTDQPKAERRYEATGCDVYLEATFICECPDYPAAQRLAERLNGGQADTERLDKLSRLVTETEFCIQVCCDDVNYPDKPAWWLERDDQILPVSLKEYSPDLRAAIDIAPNPTVCAKGE